MKKVTLVFPPMTISERYKTDVNNRKNEGHLPPLGIAHIAAVLEHAGIKVSLIDAAVMSYGLDRTAERIIETNPDIVGISILTPLYIKSVSLIKIIKEKMPSVVIMVGGPHVTTFKEKVLADCKEIDIAIIGEGEYTCLDVVNTLSTGGNLEDVKGIVYRDGNGIAVNEPRDLIKNLDDLPFPARHLLPMKSYKPLPNQYKRQPVVSMIVSRGCPYSCIYCFESIGKKFRIRSPEKVVSEVKEVMEKYGAKEISFWDDNLMLNKKWLREFCTLLIKNKLNIVWSCYGRVNQADKELLSLMKSAGCWNIFYGIESGNQDLLDLIRKDITLEQAVNAIRWTKAAGIEVRASFMLALPGETPEKALNTIKFAKEIDPDYVQFCITTPYPGTELYKTAKEYGTLIEDYSKFTVWEPVFVPVGYKDIDEIMQIQKKATSEFYFRPSYIIKRFMRVRSINDIVRYIYGLKMLSHMKILLEKSGK